MDNVGGSKLNNVLKAKEDLLKSPEELESEKKHIIAQRVGKLDLNSLSEGDLRVQAEVFQETLLKCFETIYLLGEKLKRQNYDSVELTKRAIQLEKSKSKNRTSNTVPTGMGGSIFAFVENNHPNAGTKISLFSRFERVMDRRTLAERRDIFEHPVEKEVKHEHVEIKKYDD